MIRLYSRLQEVQKILVSVLGLAAMGLGIWMTIVFASVYLGMAVLALGALGFGKVRGYFWSVSKPYWDLEKGVVKVKKGQAWEEITTEDIKHIEFARYSSLRIVVTLRKEHPKLGSVIWYHARRSSAKAIEIEDRLWQVVGKTRPY